MQLSPTTLATLRRTAVGTTIVAAGLLGGVAMAQDGGEPAPTPSPTTSAPAPTSTSTSTSTSTTVAPVITAPARTSVTAVPEPTTPPTTAVPAFDPDDCPACGMG